MDFIYGNKFAKLADFIYTIPNPADYYNFPNTFFKKDVEKFDGIPIIYTLTSNVSFLFKELNDINKNVIVITHNDDISVDENLYNLMPKTVIKWFSQNVTYKGEKLHGIPIGIENPERISFHHQDKISKLLFKIKEPRFYKNDLYVNFSIKTFPEERLNCYKQFENKSWATVIKNINIFDFDNYIDNIHNHKFVACPRGNGIETHRTWESLYLDAIPIERFTISNSFWRDLPIFFINEWSDVTRELLNKTFDDFITREWNLEKLEFSYWKNLILNYTK